jgi:hypothetical protein
MRFRSATTMKTREAKEDGLEQILIGLGLSALASGLLMAPTAFYAVELRLPGWRYFNFDSTYITLIFTILFFWFTINDWVPTVTSFYVIFIHYNVATKWQHLLCNEW